MVYKLGTDTVNTDGRTTVYQIMAAKGMLMMGYVISMLKDITGTEKPVIEAWFLTHIHEDHTSEFARILLNHRDDITVKNIYFNFPKRDWLMKNLKDIDVQWHNFELLEKAFDTYYGTEGYLDRHEGVKTGDKIYIDGIEFEILFAGIGNARNVNDTSTAIRMKTDGQTILFLGDLYFTNGDLLAEMYGDGLRSDIVQMAHHGQNGVGFNVYRLIAPDVCLWPTPDWVWHNANGIYQTTEVRQWMEELNVKHNIVAGIDGSVYFTMPFEK